MLDKKAFGARLREERKKKKLTQEKLAEMANISSYYYGELERGEKLPSADILVCLAEALSVSTDYLLRDAVSSGAGYIDSDISKKLSSLTLKQRIAVEAIIDAYIKTL